jgi:hypothetical protein
MRYHVHIRVFMSLRAYLSLSKFYKKGLALSLTYKRKGRNQREIFPSFLVFLAHSSFYQ